MTKRTSLIVTAVLSAAIGGGATTLYYELRLARDQAESATIGLSDHVNIIRALESGDVRNATRFLTLLADANVLQLINAEKGRHVNPEFRRKVLASYAQYRNKNPQFYQVPDYVDQSGRAEYENNLKKIQQFLDQESK